MLIVCQGAGIQFVLLTGAEKVNIAFKSRLEQLVPALEVSQQRNGLGDQLVYAGVKHISDLAFVDKYRDCDSRAVTNALLDLQVGHAKAPGQGAVVIFGPLDDVCEVFPDEVHQGHDAFPSGFFSWWSMSVLRCLAGTHTPDYKSPLCNKARWCF